jgi:hypothetical protein
MKQKTKLSLIFSIFLLTIALLANVKAQTSVDNMETFSDFEFPGMKIQVNATAETVPLGNITVILSLKTQTDVYVENLSLSIFGFAFGKDKTLMINITENDFQLNNTQKMYNQTFNVPGNVWDAAYGEILLTYRANLGGLELRFPKLTCGFTMTYIENVYLKSIEEQLENLNSTFWQIFQMNLTLENLAKLNETYQGFQVNQGDLDNTRRVVAILAVTTVFFVATTVYMVMRKPKESW